MPGDIPCWLVCVQKLRNILTNWSLISLNLSPFLRKITVQEIFIPLFFSWLPTDKRLMYLIILLTWVSIFKQMTGDLSFEKRTQREFAVFTMLWQCPHNRPSRHGYLLATDYKNHPIGQLWISKQRLKAKCQNLITMENKTAYCRYLCQIIGNILVCENYDSPFFFCFVCYLFVALLCLYFLCKLELFWAWPSYTRIPTFMQIPIPIPIHTHMRHLYYVRVGCCIGAMLTPGFFPFFSIACLSKKQVSPVRAELRIELPFEVVREVSQP